MRLLCLCIISLLITSCSHVYYVVRHGEKAAASASTTANDPPLTESGHDRAIALKDYLADKKIKAIYSTNTIRTKTTVQPAAEYFKLTPIIYGPKPDSAFITTLKSIRKNVLIVGHSNTVDDIANQLAGSSVVAGDLAESEFDNIFVIKYKGGKFKKFERYHYGAPAH